MSTQPGDLVEPNTPLVLADGTVIDPVTGSIVRNKPKDVEIPNNRQAVKEITAVRRRLEELPAPPKELHGISIVLSYTLLGVSDTDIAYATGLTIEQVANIKMSSVFNELSHEIVETIMKQDAEDIRRVFRQNATIAAKNMSEFLEDEDPNMRFAASRDALDRDGHRPADVVEHRHKFEDDLRIVHVKRDTTIPLIDDVFAEGNAS